MSEVETFRAAVGTLTEVSLSTLMFEEVDIASMTATIRTPSGNEEPCTLKRLENGQLGRVAVFIGLIIAYLPLLRRLLRQQFAFDVMTRRF